MIENDFENRRGLIGNTNVIIFYYLYNRNREFAEITRAYSWYDIFSKAKGDADHTI